MHDLEINQNVLLLLMNSQILEDVQAGISFGSKKFGSKKL